jgi:hypothetical protein
VEILVSQLKVFILIFSVLMCRHVTNEIQIIENCNEYLFVMSFDKPSESSNYHRVYTDRYSVSTYYIVF